MKNKILTLLKLIKFAFRSSIIGNKKSRALPKVIQLPITYECDSRCVMCNIWKMDHSNEADVNEFESFILDDLFSEVEAIGINGGEVSLVPELDKYVEKMLLLKSIKQINIISNGFRTKVLLNQLEVIYKLCKAKNVVFHVSISLDGYEKVHDEIRGIRGAYRKAKLTIDELIYSKNRYCDSFDIGCTVINQNVNHLVAFDYYVKKYKLPVRYRLGIENERIDNSNVFKDFSITINDNNQTAMEFFHKKFNEEKLQNIHQKFKYFSVYYWLLNESKKRLMGCAWKSEGVTLDSRGDIFYCAVKSKKIGSLREKDGKSIFLDSKNIDYRKYIIDNHCNNCTHDYHGVPKLSSVIVFYKEIFKTIFSNKIYKLKVKLL